MQQILVIQFFIYTKNNIQWADDYTLLAVLPIHRTHINSGWIICKITLGNNFIGCTILTGHLLTEVARTETLFICNAINRNIFLALITNRIFCNYSTKFCNHSIPLSSASSVAICVSNALILSIISAVEGYSTATYSVFLYLLIERS